MFRMVLVLSVLLACVVLISACGGATATATTAPTSSATSAAPSGISRTPLPLPPQPTSPPLGPRAPTPFASATFSPILSFPLPERTSSAPSSPTTASAQPAPTQAAQAGPTAPGIATGVRSEIKVEFVSPLATVEEVDDLRLVLMRVAGILDIAGNENAITIGYDAGLILPNQIRARLAGIGHPVKP